MVYLVYSCENRESEIVGKGARSECALKISSKQRRLISKRFMSLAIALMVTRNILIFLLISIMYLRDISYLILLYLLIQVINKKLYSV